MSFISKGKSLYLKLPDVLSSVHVEQEIETAVLLWFDIPVAGDATLCTTRPVGGFVPPIKTVKGKVVG
jgi:hypothetical protein